MGPTRLSVKRSLLFSTFFAVSLFSATSLAADTTTKNAVDSSKAAASAQSTATTATETTNTGMPNLSSSTASATSTDSESTLTGLPTLTGTTSSTSIPTYSVEVPDTSNAPFMNQSTMPDGTVFIAVGAILGAFAVAILAWRGIVACLLHRSVERAAMAQHAANDKTFAATTFPAPPAPFYKYTDRENSSPSLTTGAVPGRGVRRTNRGPTPSATLSQTNLFFSPTAAGGANPVGGVGGGNSNRASQYLPSGFYAASSASPQPGHGHGQSISLSNLRPSSRGGRDAGTLQTSSTMPLDGGPSPPDSPSVTPRGGNTPVPRNYSTSSINLARPLSELAPSAYLDDLLDDHQGEWPPAPGQGGHYGRHSPPGGRF